MAKISQEQRNRYAAKVKEYKTKSDAIYNTEQSLLNLLKQPGGQGLGYVRFKLSEQALSLASYQILVNSLSLSLLGIKNEEALGEARKSVGRSIKYLEDIFTGYVDAPFSDYEQNLVAVEEKPYEERYKHLRKIGFAITEIEDGYGTSSMWRWFFAEMWGKLAAVTKNSVNLKKVYQDLALDSPNRMLTLSYVTLIKSLLQTTADRYREKYEVSTTKIDDFKQAILFLSALKRFHMVFGEKAETEELKKKIEIWSAKLENDIRKKEEEKKKR